MLISSVGVCILPVNPVSWQSFWCHIADLNKMSLFKFKQNVFAPSELPRCERVPFSSLVLERTKVGELFKQCASELKEAKLLNIIRLCPKKKKPQMIDNGEVTGGLGRQRWILLAACWNQNQQKEQLLPSFSHIEVTSVWFAELDCDVAVPK